MAQEWRITPSITVTETFTDNVNLVRERDNPRSDLITSISPGLAVRGQSRHSTLNLDYRPEFRYYLDSSNRNRENVLNNLSGFGRVDIWEDRFIVDAAAGIARFINDPRGAFATSPATSDLNTTEVRSFSVSPRFQHRFGTFAEFLARVSYGFVDSADSQLGDSSSFTQSVALQAGPQFTSWRWGLTASHSKIDRQSGIADQEESRFEANATYILTEQIALTGSIGFQDLEDQTISGDNDGLIWSIGTILRPNRQTSLRVSYGRDFGRENKSFTGVYEPSARTRISADYSESIQTSQRLVLQDLLFLGVNPQGILIDTRSGLPFNFGGNLFGFQAISFRQERFGAQASATRGRSTYGLNAFAESRETDVTRIEQTVYGFGANYGRTLSRQVSGNVGLGYSHTDFGTNDGREDDRIELRASLSYFLLRDVQANLSYIRTQRLTNIDGEDISENAVSVSVTKTF